MSQISKRGADRLLHSSSAIFFPLLLIEVAVLSADATCSHTHIGSEFLCHHMGLQFLAMDCPQTRRVSFFTTLFLVMHVWQMYIYQFPRWDIAMRAIPPLQNLCFQLAILTIATATLLTLGGLFLSVYMPHMYEAHFHLTWLPDPDTWAWIALLGWTVWLLVFSRVVLMQEKVGGAWVDLQRGPSPPALPAPITLQNMARSLRLSQMLLFTLFFMAASGGSGYLKAQLDLTLITIATPAVMVAMYALLHLSMQLNATIVYVCTPFCFVLSLLVCSCMTSRVGGRGSFMLVFAHAIGKSLQYFGNDMPGHEEEGDGGYDDDDDTEPVEGMGGREGGGERSGGGMRRRSCSRSYEDLLVMATASSRGERRGGTITPTQSPMGRRSSSYNELTSELAVDRRTALGGGPSPHTVRHKEAAATLAGRGQIGSALVSAEIPHGLRHHWILQFSSRTVGFGLHMARAWAMSSTAMVGVMKAGTALGVVMALILGIISIASVLQQNMQLFPKLISYHSTDRHVLLNHIISNVTLVKNPHLHAPPAPSAEGPGGNWKGALRKPYYVACDLRWNSLSLLDLSIFSELSYFDSDSAEGPSMQDMLDELFPEMDFRHIPLGMGDGGEDCDVQVGEEDMCSVSNAWTGRGETRRGRAVPEWVTRAVRRKGADQGQGTQAETSVGRGQPAFLEAYSEKLGKECTRALWLYMEGFIWGVG